MNTIELRLKRDILGLSEKRLDKFEITINDMERNVKKDTE